MTDPRALLAIQMAVNLIASGGKYAHRRVGDVVEEVIDEMVAAEALFSHIDADCDCPACSGTGGGESVH